MSNLRLWFSGYCLNGFVVPPPGYFRFILMDILIHSVTYVLSGTVIISFGKKQMITGLFICFIFSVYFTIYLRLILVLLVGCCLLLSKFMSFSLAVCYCKNTLTRDQVSKFLLRMYNIIYFSFRWAQCSR